MIMKMTPLRLNIIIIALLIAAVGGGILALLFKAIGSADAGSNSFIIGALIGLLGSVVTGLASLGTTLINDNGKSTGNPDD